MQLQETGKGDTGARVAAVTDFLDRYGYLPGGTTRTESVLASFDGRIEQAIATYQRLHGKRETGLLDVETLGFMNTPRCGVADILNSAEVLMLAEQAAGWGRRDITFTMDLTHDLPPLRAELVRQTLVTALNVWATAGGLRFTVRFPADIFVAFRRGDHGDGHPQLAFDRMAGGILGHGFPPRHPRLAGHVHLDADEQWSMTVPVTGSADFPTVLLHELGHALGLEHNTADPLAVMYERFAPGTLRRTLGASDEQALISLYGNTV